jgi:hypothetical protein
MMLDRKLAAVGLLAILSVVWSAGARTFATLAAPAGQVELMRGAIHAGSCRTAEGQPIAVLESFTRSGAPDDTAAPLLSYTDAPVPLSDLLASPHAMLITVGGDRNALLACGDIRGPAGAPTANVDLSEQNSSGLSGIALLIGNADITQISIIMNEAGALVATPVAGTPGTPGTPVAGSPTAASPSPTAEASPTASIGFPIPTIPGGPTATATPGAPTPAPGQLTPGPGAPTPTAAAGGAPSIPIFLPPIAGQVTPVVTEVAPTEAVATPAGTTLTTYTSTEFGYAVAIPAGWEYSGEPEVEPGRDAILLENGVSSVGITGRTSPLAAPECVDEHFNYLRTLPDVNLIVPHTGPDAALRMRTPERAIEVWDFTVVNMFNQLVPYTLYVECRVLVADQANLLVVHQAPAAEYQAQVSLRDELLRGLSLP